LPSKPAGVVERLLAFGEMQDKHAANPRFPSFSVMQIPSKGAGGDLLIVRIPSKGGPTADAEFLRRVLLDVAGRPPTALEMHYFLKDTDADKHRKLVEKVVEQQDPHQSRIEILVTPQKVPDRASRAEEYIKDKLGKKQLSADERHLLLKALEFAEKDRPPTTPQRVDVDRLWREMMSIPKVNSPSKEMPK
jgi:hypothetical protein